MRSGGIPSRIEVRDSNVRLVLFRTVTLLASDLALYTTQPILAKAQQSISLA